MAQFKKVVIIGGGFGGIQVAKELANKEVEVLLIDKHNYHTFQPLLYQVATGGLEPDSIAFPLRKIFKNQPNFSFRLTEVVKINPLKKILETTIGAIPYDLLVIASGSTTNFYGNPDMEKLSMPMKTIPEALNLRSLILQHFEEALLQDTDQQKQAFLNFVVVGGGPTGVETAGALAELKQHVLPSDYPELNLKNMEVYLVEANERILKAMSENASYKANHFLKDMGVKVIHNTRVLLFDGNQIHFSNGQTLACKNVIWTAGVKGASILGIDPPSIHSSGKYLCNSFNQVKYTTDIFAIGDVAHIENDPAYPYGHPGVAPVAIQQGKHLAQNILRLISSERMAPFAYTDKGSMATVGRNKAVVDLSFIRFQGIFAWFVWMFVHIMTLIGFRNKVIVMINWIWNYFSFDRGIRLIIRPYKKPIA